MFQAAAKSKQNPNVMEKGQSKIKSTSEYAQYHKFILRSKDAAGSTNNNALNGTPCTRRFDNITFPTGVTGKGVLIVDSFVSQNPTAELDGGYTVSIKEIFQPRTFGSDREGTTDIVLTSKGAIWQNGSVGNATCGIPINNLSQFRNTSLTVQIDGIATNAATTFNTVGEYVLTFWIITIE